MATYKIVVLRETLTEVEEKAYMSTDLDLLLLEVLASNTTVPELANLARQIKLTSITPLASGPQLEAAEDAIQTLPTTLEEVFEYLAESVTDAGGRL